MNSSSNSSVKSAKSAEEERTLVAEGSAEIKTEKLGSAKESKEGGETDTKEVKSSKKRKANSRTPTPVSVVVTEGGGNTQASPLGESVGGVPVPVVAEKKDTASSDNNSEKHKKVGILI